MMIDAGEDCESLSLTLCHKFINNYDLNECVDDGAIKFLPRKAMATSHFLLYFISFFHFFVYVKLLLALAFFYWLIFHFQYIRLQYIIWGGWGLRSDKRNTSNLKKLMKLILNNLLFTLDTSKFGEIGFNTKLKSVSFFLNCHFEEKAMWTSWCS